LALAKELTNPTLVLEPKVRLVPNVIVPVPETIIQFDGVLIPTDASNANVLQYITDETNPWEIVDVKLQLSARRTTGSSEVKNKKPRKKHLDELKIQLGRFLMFCCTHLNATPLPRSVRFVYLNGILPSKIHVVKIDLPYLKEWQAETNAALVAAENQDSQDEGWHDQPPLFDLDALTIDETAYLDGILLGLIDWREDQEEAANLS